MSAKDLSRQKENEAKCVCPFCEEAMDPQAPWCQTCEVVVRFCAVCKMPLLAGAAVCQSCGAECEG